MSDEYRDPDIDGIESAKPLHHKTDAQRNDDL
jgi:hypothetical protein